MSGVADLDLPLTSDDRPGPIAFMLLFPLFVATDALFGKKFSLEPFSPEQVSLGEYLGS